MTTLRHALTQAKSSLPCKVSARNTRASNWPKFKDNDNDMHQDVRTWDAFTIENLNESYGHVLDAPVPEGQLDVPDPRTAFAILEITRPEHINSLIKWCDGVLGPTLEHARTRLHLGDGVALKRNFTAPNAPGSKVKVLSRPNHDGKGRVKMDHLIELDDFPLPSLVVGLGRPSKSFSARDALSNGGRQPTENMWPMMQLANLCFLCKTRYGYILTDEDLVVCRFSALDPDNVKYKWSAEVMPIPWSKSGQTQLTTDLALWWLCMLALSNPQNRRVVRPWEMVSIDSWEPPHKHDDERGWTQRHWYSKFERTVDEPPPEYESPAADDAQGQAAAFQGAVGLNGDADFAIDPDLVFGGPGFLGGPNNF